MQQFYSRPTIWRHMILMVLVVILSACSSIVNVVTNITEVEANEILSILLNSGLHATKTLNKEGAASVSVDSTEVAVAIDILRARGLPRVNYTGLGDTFKKEGMVSSPIEERARYLHALSEELSRTLSNIDGVMLARVHLVLPEHNAFTDATTPSSAAVFIKYQKSYNLDILQPQIKKLVSNSIPGLSTDRVSVVLVPGQDYSKTVRYHVKKIFGVQVQDNSAQTLIMILVGLGVLAFAGIVFGLYMMLSKKK